jgi:hypothetical protein
MKFKYYHGTSSIFLDSIMKYGLGGINPNVKYRNLDLLRFLATECEKKIPHKPEYAIGRHAVLGMANQQNVELALPFGGTFLANYKHDKIYVALTLERAIIYACDNKYGSEILEYCIMLYKFLREENENFELPKELNLFNIEKYIDKQHKPILIEVTDVIESDLETEYGENGTEYLSHLRKILPGLDREAFNTKLAYSNFQLLKPIKEEKLKIYEVDFEGKVGNDDFEFTLTKLKAST